MKSYPRRSRGDITPTAHNYATVSGRRVALARCTRRYYFVVVLSRGGRRVATRPSPSPRSPLGGEKAADTFYRRSQLRLARQGWPVMFRGGRKRQGEPGGGGGAIRAPRQKPSRGTNGRLSSHLRLVHIPQRAAALADERRLERREGREQEEGRRWVAQDERGGGRAVGDRESSARGVA